MREIEDGGSLETTTMFSYFTLLVNDLLDTRNEVRAVPKRLYAAAVSLSKRYRLVAMLEGRAGPVNSFSFNLNGSLLASGGDDEEVQIWDLHVLR